MDVNNSTNISKTNNHLSYQTAEHSMQWVAVLVEESFLVIV